MTAKNLILTPNEALILQQVHEDGEDDLWIRLTNKGRQLVNYMWPESRAVMA